MDDTRDPSREVVNESNRSLVVGYGAIRPVINEYPKTACGKRTFSFQSCWYELYPWLEYSEKNNAVFFFYCRCFGTLGKFLLI